jgi:hypothetical protein
MDVIEQAGNVRASVQRRRHDHRDERLEEANEALRTENRALRDQLARDRSGTEMVLAGSTPRTHRARRTLAVVIAAGAAYLALTKAGRERYGQMRAWLSGTKEELALNADELREDSAGAVGQTGASMERTADRAGETLKQAAAKAGHVANETAQKAGDRVAESAERAGRKIVEPR